ncbi:MAG TPA: hypothetical protein VFV15_06865 [Moraxellaceae bacterium]|nr:hypothetical protein [Moraxellaceae bacterium]
MIRPALAALVLALPPAALAAPAPAPAASAAPGTAAAPTGTNDAPPSAPAAAVTVTPASFKCLTAMTAVRGFFVDNLAGNLEGTLAAARNPAGTPYPPGSVVQLVPTEVMVKREPGFSPVTRDWEFFELDVDDKGSRIRKRGFAEVNNRFGKNCFACHAAARPEFDLVCEQTHGCEELPIPRYVIRSLQATDPRCTVRDASLAQRFTSWMVQKLAPN